MVTVFITILIMLAFVEWYAFGVYCLAKKAGEADVVRCFIPFYAFAMTRRLTGEFKILTIPVKNFAGMMAEVAGVTLLALMYACWGDAHLPDLSANALWEIMSVIFLLMAVVAWIAFLISSERLFRRFNVQKKGLCVLLCALVISIPLVYVFASKNTPRLLKDMY